MRVPRLAPLRTAARFLLILLAGVPILLSAATTPEWQVIGQSGGWTRAVAVQGQYAYAGIGSRVVVVDISDPGSLREAGSSSRLPHNVQDIALSGKYAYVAAGAGGLRVLDISDPARLVEIGSWASPGFARGVAVSGSYAYLADGPFGLRIIDVSNPAQPREAASAFVLQNACKVRVDGQYAYVAAAGAGLLTVDVSNPAQPAERATARVGGYAYDLAVGDGYAYVAAGWEGLQVLNVADPTRPAPAAGLKLPGWAFGIALAKGHAFVADSLKGLRTVDISDPQHPAEIGSLEWYSALAYSVALAGDLAFVADGQWGLHAIDVSNPSQPSRAGFYGAMAHASNVAISGDLAYVAAGFSGFRVLDISDLTRPRELGAYGDGQSYFTHVWVDRNIAYVTSILGASWGLHVLDVSDPSRPRQITDFLPSIGQVHDLAVANGIAYLACEHEMVVLDVSDPSHPIEKYILPLSNEFGAFDVPLVVSGTRAYMGLHGVQIIDLSDSLRPVLLGSYLQDVGGLAVQGDIVYVSRGGTLSAVDVSNPANPTEIISFSGSGMPTGVAVLGNRLYVAAGNGGLDVFDLSDPRSPALASSVKTPGNAHGLAVQGSTVYVADESGGLTILQEGSNATAAPAQSRWAGLSPRAPAPDIVPPIPQRPPTGVVCVVTSTSDSGPGTLRECLGKGQYGDTVTFDAAVFPPSRPATISLQTALPAVSAGGVTIDGSDAGVVLDGSHTPPGSDGVGLRSDDNVVRGLEVVGFPGEGIAVWGSRATIGGDRKSGRGPLGQGNLASGNGQDGIRLDGTPADCVVVGNLIGTTLDGRSAWPNGTGLTIDNGTGNLVKDNVISGNTGSGVSMPDWGTGFNSIVGNLIGTDASGTTALGNGGGVGLAFLGFNRVGGTDPGERNVISGNAGMGMWIGQGIGNLVLGNYIGVDARGSALLVNRDGGISIGDKARETVIGGTTDSERNVFGVQAGAAVRNGTDFNFIAGNAIGTDAGGSAALGGFRGIQILSASHTIVQGNLIANSATGVEVQGGAFNTIRRNAIWRNQGLGIVIENGNEAISAPLITQSSHSSVSGRTCAGCTVEVFSDDAFEGRNFEGETVADASGAFAFTKAAGFAASNVTLTATDRAGNTSEFSSCVAQVSVSEIDVPAGGVSGRLTVTAPPGCRWQPTASDWIAMGGQYTGSAALAYTVPANTSAAARTGTIAIGGQMVTIRQEAAPSSQPLPEIDAVVSAASYAAGASPGSWLAIFGKNLASLTRGWTGSDFFGARLPADLEGVSVYVNGRPGAISYSSPTQINVLAPDDTAEGPVAVQVFTPHGVSAPFTTDLRPVSPGLFAFTGSGRSYVAAVHPDGEYAVDPAVLPGVPARAAQPGDIISIYGTGFGPTTPPTPAGYLVQQPAPLASLPAVRIGDLDAAVQYAGRVMAGLDQINIVVPDLPEGDYTVTATVGGRQTDQQVFLTVRVP